MCCLFVFMGCCLSLCVVCLFVLFVCLSLCVVVCLYVLLLCVVCLSLFVVFCLCVVYLPLCCLSLCFFMCCLFVFICCCLSMCFCLSLRCLSLCVVVCLYVLHSKLFLPYYKHSVSLFHCLCYQSSGKKKKRNFLHRKLAAGFPWIWLAFNFSKILILIC